MSDALTTQEFAQLCRVAFLRPTGSKVLILRDTVADTVGSLVIPDSSRKPRENITTGTVVAVGPGSINKKGRRVPCSVQPGDRVMFGFNDGEDFPDGYSVLKDSEIRAVIGEQDYDKGAAFAGNVRSVEPEYVEVGR